MPLSCAWYIKMALWIFLKDNLCSTGFALGKKKWVLKFEWNLKILSEFKSFTSNFLLFNIIARYTIFIHIYKILTLSVFMQAKYIPCNIIWRVCVVFYIYLSIMLLVPTAMYIELPRTFIPVNFLQCLFFIPFWCWKIFQDMQCWGMSQCFILKNFCHFSKIYTFVTVFQPPPPPPHLKLIVVESCKKFNGIGKKID